MATRHHGIIAKEASSGVIALTDSDTSTIGLLAFADDADADFFPLNTPVLVTSISKAISNAGTTGNLRRSLENISNIVSPTLIVVRVENPINEIVQDSIVIGENSQPRTGLYSFLTAKSITSLTPKIIIAPDVETPEVTQAIIAICKKLRAFSYITPRTQTGEMLATQEDVTAFRNTIDSREIMLIWPEFTSNNILQNEDIVDIPLSSEIMFKGDLGQSSASGFWQVEAVTVNNDNLTEATLYQKVLVGLDNVNANDTDLEFNDSFLLTLNSPSYTQLSNKTSQNKELHFEWISESNTAMPTINPVAVGQALLSPLAVKLTKTGFTVRLAGKVGK